MSLDVYLDMEPCPTCGHGERVYDANITHNLSKMADRAGIYKCLWHPKENGFTEAHQLIEPIRAGLALLRAEPDRFRELSSSNGWGTYEQFIPWVERYLVACMVYPAAKVSTWV